MLSTTAIGIKKIGIIELMMCRVLPLPIKRPIMQKTETMAITIGAVISLGWRKK